MPLTMAAKVGASRTTDDAPPVPGRLYPLTPADLTAADAYEGEAYRRVWVRTEAGAEAWVYVATC